MDNLCSLLIDFIPVVQVSIVASYIKERTKNAQFIVISLRNNMVCVASLSFLPSSYTLSFLSRCSRKSF